MPFGSVVYGDTRAWIRPWSLSKQPNRALLLGFTYAPEWEPVLRLDSERDMFQWCFEQRQDYIIGVCHLLLACLRR